MNTSHYPSLALCKKLTEIGFPETESEWRVNGFGVSNILGPRQVDTEEMKIFIGVCPSVMELLDVMPHYITEDWAQYELNIRMNGESKLVMYVAGMGMISHFYGTLPNALAEMILWLHENKYISFSE